jgi:hypothetical protein
MNEKLVFRFFQNGNPLPIDDLAQVELDRGGVLLDGETSAWPRALRFDFEGAGPFKDNLNALRNQVADGSHRFSVMVEHGALIITTLNPNRIPTGTYDYRLRISDLDIQNDEGRIQLIEDGAPIEIEINARPKSHRIDPADSLQNDLPIFELVNGGSLIDNKKIIEWLGDDTPRAKRQACLLNILGRMRISPTPDAPLINFVQEIFFADVSRIYAKVNPQLFNRLQELDQHTQKPFSLDHGPIDPVHLQLLRRIPSQDQDATENYRKTMKSFRQDSQPSLQIVVFPPPDNIPGRGCYADIDIDLGNPKRDLAGFFIHLGELMTEGKTDHIKLNKKLKKDPILNEHLHYTITEI